jgi:FlaA1/EpsC-like NDP-sugar epimerase
LFAHEFLEEVYKMKILVTGGTGNVGAEVVKELQKRK